MTDRLRVAAQAALDDLEARCGSNAGERGPDGSITKLRAALAEQDDEINRLRADIKDMIERPVAEQEAEQKPAAWIREDTAITTDAYQASCWRDAHTVTPLYTTPPRREWVGLTERERLDIRTEWNCRPQRSYADLMDMTAAALKEKNT